MTDQPTPSGRVFAIEFVKALAARFEVSPGTIVAWTVGSATPALHVQQYILDALRMGQSDIEWYERRIQLADVDAAKYAAQRDGLKALLAEAIEALIWCSGSADYGPGGQAHEGWKRGPAVVIEKSKAVLP